MLFMMYRRDLKSGFEGMPQNISKDKNIAGIENTPQMP